MASEQQEKGEEDTEEDEKERKEEERRERRRKKRAAEVEELTSAGHQALKQEQPQEALQLFRLALKAASQKHSLAVSGYLRAAESYRVANMPQSAALALKEAATHMVQSEFSPREVTKVLSDCLSLTNSITNQSILGELYLSVGVVYCQVHLFDEAVQCFQKALNPASQLQEHPLLAKVLLNLGAALNAVGEFKAALEYHHLAAKIYGTLGLRRQQAQCFSNLALACRRLGNDEEAIESFNHALQGFTDSGDHSAQVQVCEALAEVYLKQRKQHKAINLYRQALLSLSHCQDSEGVGQRLVEHLTAALQSTLAQKARPCGQMRPHPLSPLSRRLDTPCLTETFNQQKAEQKGEEQIEPLSEQELHTDRYLSPPPSRSGPGFHMS